MVSVTGRTERKENPSRMQKRQLPSENRCDGFGLSNSPTGPESGGKGHRAKLSGLKIIEIIKRRVKYEMGGKILRGVRFARHGWNWGKVRERRLIGRR